MFTAILICSGLSVYMLASLVILLFSTCFELPRCVEYVLCVVCFPWVVACYLGFSLNSIFHFYDDDDDDED